MRQLDKEIGILIVDPVSAVVSTVKRVLQEQGYKNLYQADSVMDGLNTMGTNKIDWVFSSLFHGQKLTGWHFLRLPLEFEAYRHVMTSVLLNSDENGYVPTLYSLGMNSCHIRPITYNSFKAEIERYLNRLRVTSNHQQAIAADLRDHLHAQQAVDEVERLELGLYKWSDSSPPQKIRVIQSQLKAGNNLEALLGMKQLIATHPENAAAIGDLSKKYLGIDDIADYKTRINVQEAVIVDSDEAQQKFIADCLKEMGVKDLKTFSDPTAACTYLKDNTGVDLLVTEWKLHGMDGSGFCQFAKLGSMRDKPLIVYSSLVGESEEKLIQEIGGIFVLKKALPKRAFKEAVSEIFSRWRYPVEGEDIEQKIHQSLVSGDIEYARQLMVQYESLTKVEKQRKVTLRAAFAFYEGDYPRAKALIIESSKIKLPTHREIGLLGKILLKLGSFADAQKCLEQANQMVPGNVERLCNMADMSAALGKDADTMKYLKEASTLAEGASLVSGTYARHAAALGQGEDARRFMGDEEIARGVVAHMNNLGVAYASASNWKESIESYVKALKALGDLHEDLQGTVYYNLGLSLVRQGRNKEALPVLKNAQSKASMLVAKKASRLSERVQNAIETNTTLNLKEAPKEIDTESVKAIAPPGASPLQDYVDLQQALAPGAHALYRIYMPSQQIEVDLLAEFPKVIKKSA